MQGPTTWYTPWLQGSTIVYIPTLSAPQWVTELSDHLHPAYVTTDEGREVTVQSCACV